MSTQFDRADAVITALGDSATLEETEYALRDFPTSVVRVALARRAAAGGGAGSITEITSDDESVTITDGTGPVVDLSAVGGAGFLTATATLTDAQILALPTTPILVLANPAPTEAVVILGGLIRLNDVAGAYTNIGAPSQVALVQTSSGLEASCYVGFSALAQNGRFVPLLAAVTEGDEGYIPITNPLLIGQGLNLFSNNSTSDFTGGNAANTLQVVVYYMLVTV